MKESKLQKTIIEILKYEKCYVLRLNSGSIISTYKGKNMRIKLCPEGTPDLLAVFPPFGIIVFIEIKKDKKTKQHWLNTIEKYKKTGAFAKSNKKIVAQHLQMNEIEKTGGETALVSSVNELQYVISVIKKRKLALIKKEI